MTQTYDKARVPVNAAVTTSRHCENSVEAEATTRLPRQRRVPWYEHSYPKYEPSGESLASQSERYPSMKVQRHGNLGICDLVVGKCVTSERAARPQA